MRKACAIVLISRTLYAYAPTPRDDTDVIETLIRLADSYPRYGFGKLFSLLRRKGKKRLPTRNPQPLAVPPQANCCWSVDFMHDSLSSGQRFRTFNVVDDYSRECLAIGVDTSLPAARILRVLDRVAAWRGYPEKLRMDNGPELISIQMAEWAEAHGVELEFIQPGKPTQNSYVERFNRTYRTEVLDYYLFSSLAEVKEITANWLKQYNEERPHESLGNIPPAEYLEINSPQKVSTFGWH
ncbi:hypothetical protein Defa_15530 [Desulfovibrio sp. TH_2024_36128]|uniref:Integrase catalytic domain-containing protein n=1 Tax=Desulfovibrio falkowii TaxID=3136602 RepID=A0ABQ0E8W1_9BACT